MFPSLRTIFIITAWLICEPAHAIGPDCVNGPLKSNKICDLNATPAERAAGLVSALQQQEKLDNLVSKAKGSSRLGLPPYNWWGEALHGVAGAPGINFSSPFNSATSFPTPLLMAAAFDDDLIYEVATVIGTEARAFGNGGKAPLDFWTPNVNPYKDPRWGRGSETPGEDTLRIKGYAKEMLAGLEGNLTQRRIIATCKHYVANDLESWESATRHNFDAKITQQDLAEYYMQPFQQCARDSKVGSFMCSYNSINGVPACANTFLLNTVLRDHWNWTADNNYITSDCEAVLDVWQNHHYASSNAAGTALTFNSGMDTSCEYESSSDIPGAWKSGELNQSTVDRALNRLYHGLVRVGYFDGPKAVYTNLGASDVNTPAAQQLAQRSAADSIVMLKNDGTLPLSLKAGSRVAMIGFWANDTKKLQGGYSGSPPFLHTPVYAAQKLGLTVSTATGPILQDANARDNWTTKALAAAQGSDYILYLGGQDTSAAGEGSDRTTLGWPTAQINLIKKLGELGKPLVVVQMGDMLDNTPLLDNRSVNSILWASWPGQDGGPAVLQVVTGEKAVAGRLPVTQYPANYTKLAMTDMSLRPSASNPGRTYRWYSTPVQAFGFGLHYTTFKVLFGAMTARHSIPDILNNCENQYLDTCSFPNLPIVVTNTGDRTSDFVTLAFVAGRNGPAPYPLKTLAAYKRLRGVAAGKTVNTTLSWTLGSFARHDANGNLRLYPGTYQILLDEPTQVTFNLTLTGSETVLDKWPTPPKL